MHSYFACRVAWCHITISADDTVLSNSTKVTEMSILKSTQAV